MGCSRQEDWSELPFSTPGDLPDPGIEPASSISPAGRLFATAPRHNKLFFYLIFFTEVQLIYKIMPISAVQQSNSFIHTYTFLILFSITVYHRILNTIPWAIQ